ncbi:MAG: hypothetical protein MJZ34_10655 [Paludibacteraceae bacterium]|nr:hypothetical protein [Paludibacteraceae bacterium]
MENKVEGWFVPYSEIRKKKFMADQIKYMQDIKWFRGEEINADPTDKFLLDWIASGGAAEFREKWESKYGKVESNEPLPEDT